MSYHVTVAAFSGPFDLLLHLIARHRVDIWEIPIAEITDAYVAALRGVEHLDLEVATEFLVVAATLIELKAARLLPVDPDDEDAGLALEMRDLLYARLLDYRTFRQAAADLRERLDAHAGCFPRDVPPEPWMAALRPVTPLAVTAAVLAALAAAALAAKPVPRVDLSHVQPVRITVREAAAMVLDELTRADRPLTFAELTAGCRHASELVVHFLALLELYKHQHVDLDQGQTFGDLVVTATDLVGALVDLTDLHATVDGEPAVSQVQP